DAPQVIFGYIRIQHRLWSSKDHRIRVRSFAHLGFDQALQEIRLALLVTEMLHAYCSQLHGVEGLAESGKVYLGSRILAVDHATLGHIEGDERYLTDVLIALDCLQDADKGIRIRTLKGRRKRILRGKVD